MALIMAGISKEQDIEDTDKDICIYHHKKWRNKFQFVINKLCGKVIPLRYNKRVGKLVCTCRQDERDKSKMDAESLKSLKKYYQNLFDKPTSLLCDVENLLCECLFDTSPSKRKLLHVIKQCLEQNFKIFEPQVKSKNLWKQTYDYEKTFELIIPMQYIQFIFGSGGHNIKDICREYDCEIRFDIRRYGSSRYMRLQRITAMRMRITPSPVLKVDPVGEKVNVKIYSKKVETANIVKDILAAHISKKKEKREKHDRQEEKWSQRNLNKRLEVKMSRSTYATMGKDALDPWRAAVGMKEMLARNYEVKAHKKKKDRKRYERTPKVCRNCLEHFTKNTIFEDGACKFHPGYLTKKTIEERVDFENMASTCSITESSLKEVGIWSCCDEICDSNFNKTEIHRETGCTTGHHLYRPVKKSSAKRKPSASLYSSDI